MYARYWDVRGVCHGWRPAGTRDWLLFYTQRGRFLVRYRARQGKDGGPGIADAKGEIHGGPGDIILYRPGTAQDYGQHNRERKWLHVWVHWVPRPEVMEWLNWPQPAPGLHHLHVPAEARAAVLRELVLVDTSLHNRHPHSQAMAHNALERALLTCASLLPRASASSASRASSSGTTPSASPAPTPKPTPSPTHLRQQAPVPAPHHPCIERAARSLTADLAHSPPLEELARRHGFSRSRFAALFVRQIGHTPRRYQELQRLSRARDLLLYTGQNVQQIAEQLGFSTPFYFSLRFKQHYGESPRTYRDAARAA